MMLWYNMENTSFQQVILSGSKDIHMTLYALICPCLHVTHHVSLPHLPSAINVTFVLLERRKELYSVPT